jgi:hypothetical protein
MQLGDYETALKEYLPQVTRRDHGHLPGTVLYYTARLSPPRRACGERRESSSRRSRSKGDHQSNDGPRVVLPRRCAPALKRTKASKDAREIGITPSSCALAFPLRISSGLAGAQSDRWA